MIRKFCAAASLLLLTACATHNAPALRNSVPIPTPPRRTAEPSAFAGLSADALRRQLGAPAFSRKDGTTDMWRYDTSACHAFFFLTGAQVTHVETIPHSGDEAADPACLNSLKKKS